MREDSTFKRLNLWPEWMRPETAAEYTGLSKKYLYNLASAEAIRCFHPAKRVLLFARRDLDEYIEKHGREAIGAVPGFSAAEPAMP